MLLADKGARPGAAAFPVQHQTAAPPLRLRSHGRPIVRRSQGCRRDRCASQARGVESDHSRHAFHLRLFKWHLDDRCGKRKLRSKRVADLELGLTEGWRYPILETARDRAQAHELATVPYPVDAREAEAEARCMGERTSWSIDHPDEHGPRSIGACLQWPEPWLGDLPH